MEGFEAGVREIPPAPVEVPAEGRERAACVLMCVALGHTPETVAGFLADGFPATVTARLKDGSMEASEMSDHLDLLLGVLHVEAS